MSRDGWEPRPLPLEHPELALALERLAHPEADVCDPRYVDWLYRANPAGVAVVRHAATDADAPASAGHFALVPARFEVDGAPRVVGVGVNALTHPAYRRRGVFKALVDSAVEAGAARGFAFAFAVPNERSLSHPGFTRAAGFADIGGVPLLLAPPWSRPRPDAGHRVEEVEAGWPGWDDAWPRRRGKYPVMGARDRAFMAWRFGACPTRRYRLYAARRDGEVSGHVVTRVATIRGFRAGLVVDLLAAPGAASALLARAAAEFREAGAWLHVSLMTTASEEFGCLRRAGFHPCPGPLAPYRYRVVAREARESIERWHLTLGDYDVV